MKRALILGESGFIGSHMARRLKSEGYWVAGIDIKEPEFEPTACDAFRLMDLRDIGADEMFFLNQDWDEIYQFAADMGGAGYVFSGEHDADIMSSSAMINLNVCLLLKELKKNGKQKPRLFFSSSACVYPKHNQTDAGAPDCREDTAIPANPDSVYGFEKLFSEILYESARRNYDMDIRIARFHNIFGAGTYKGGKEKAPAALCRKVIEAPDGGEIEIWGDGEQTRSFLFIDECLEGVRRLMNSDCTDILNIGSDEMVSINQLAQMIISISGKSLKLKHVKGCLGVRGRNSHNDLIYSRLGWRPSAKLIDGLEKTYQWIESEMRNELSR